MEKRFEIEMRCGQPSIYEVSHLGKYEGFTIGELEYLLDGMLEMLGLDVSMKCELLDKMRNWGKTS